MAADPVNPAARSLGQAPALVTSETRPARIDDALGILERFATSAKLTARISRLEQEARSRDRGTIADLLSNDKLDSEVLAAALLVKNVARQIDVVVHALGILIALPHILEDGEQVLNLSLGAGNTGRPHDLETDRRIAEFKFIGWQGGPESIRQNGLFVDLFNLASARTDRKRELYVVGTTIPLRFLNNRRSLTSVLSKDSAVAGRFRELHGDRFATVNEYYATVRDLVQIIDVSEIVPSFKLLAAE
jgi:hypothetical protein